MKIILLGNEDAKLGSQYQQEADLAMEESAPFNNREIILKLLDLSKNKDYKDVFDDIIIILIQNFWIFL